MHRRQMGNVPERESIPLVHVIPQQWHTRVLQELVGTIQHLDEYDGVQGLHLHLAGKCHSSKAYIVLMRFLLR